MLCLFYGGWSGHGDFLSLLLYGVFTKWFPNFHRVSIVLLSCVYFFRVICVGLFDLVFVCAHNLWIREFSYLSFS